MSKIDWIQQEIDGLKSQGLYNNIRTIGSPQGAWLTVDGKRVLNFCSNNYLGLANHPALTAAAKKATDEMGVGPAAVRSIAGTMTLHVELEKRLAQFKGVEAAITFQSGFTANLATVPALVGKEDVIFSDRLNHASIIDGCRLSGAKIVAYEHNDVKSLEEQIQANLKNYRRALIITDGVFSMEGTIADLPALKQLADRYDCLLIIDESHATGVLGETGRGTAEHFGVLGAGTVQTSTLGKALGGACGGYVAGSQLVCDYLVQRSRTQLFSNALPPSVCYGAMAAMDVLMKDGKTLLARLRDNTAYFRAGVRELGLRTLEGITPIVPVIVGETSTAIAFQDTLFQEGVFVSGFGYPVVPKGEARLRCQISAGHTREDLDLCLKAFGRVADRFPESRAAN